jgi:hypothetical protein
MDTAPAPDVRFLSRIFLGLIVLTFCTAMVAVSLAATGGSEYVVALSEGE